MAAALACGFMHHLVPPQDINFERLHIFLFNLVTGGTLLIYFTENRRKLTIKGRIFFLLSLLFAVCAFMKWYIPTLLLPLLLAAIVENVRTAHFGSVLPKALFTKAEPTSRKFHQASLLCLSLGLIISNIAILNEEFTHWFVLEKFTLDTFFLGYSFPVSLISMSVIFSLMRNRDEPADQGLKELSFWFINLGVIIFFLFILAGLFLPQVFIATTLFFTVVLILYLYWQHGLKMQQKAFLTSGIFFLLITSISGILYIFLEFSAYYEPAYSLPLLRTHAFTALYGWNLSGLAVISRHGDFPIKLHSRQVILLHWVTVLFLCPLGYFFPAAAVCAIICYCILVYILLFNHSSVDYNLVKAENRILGKERTPAKPSKTR